ncbi:MAG: hypothetical protein K2N55_09960, partial [Lachnospiraceae bacterium]|nr:hypothetical protein [Lachnospiraceae bacterium]
MMSQLYCGAGRAEITPPKEMAPLLPGLGPQKITGILDPLFVRIILIQSGQDKAMLVSVDLDKAPNQEEFLEALSEKTCVPKEAILYFGIHTHTAPVMGYRPFEPLDVEKLPEEEQKAFYEYTDLIKKGLLKAAKEAAAGLKPAKIGCGHGESFINVNRICSYEAENEQGDKKKLIETGYNGAGPVSRDVFVMRIESLSGEPIAFFVNYACHNVVMFLHDAGDGGIHISHDMGGAVSLNLEKRYPGAVAVWSSGAAGDLNPIMSTQNYFPHISSGRADLTPFKDFSMSVELRDRLAGRHLLDILEANKKIVCDVQNGEIYSALAFISVPEGEQRDEDVWSHSRIRLHLVNIGEIAFIGVNGELFCSLGEIIKQSSPKKDTVVINHDCSLMLDNPGYVLDDDTNALCKKADLVLTPHDGFKAHAGYLLEQLSIKT